MKKILYMILAVSSVVVLQGCGDYLNNPPKGMTIPERAEDYKKLMASSSMMGNTLSSDQEYLTDNIHLFNKDASASYYVFVNKDESLQNIYSFKPGQINAMGTMDYNWNYAYGRIFTWNTVINNVMDSKGAPDVQKRALKAEALFGRAYDYFMLVNVYGRHYDKATASKDYGIPLITEENINQKFTRQTVQEVYDKILADLKEAEADLPEKTDFKNHPDQCALKAFYAKIYFYMGDYAKALDYADKALAVNSNILDLNDYIMQTGKTWDRVVLKADPTKRFPDIDHPENIYVRWNSGQLHGQVALSRSLRDVFKKDTEHDTTDLRKYYFTSEDSVSFGSTPAFFKGECIYAFYSNVNTGLSSVDTKLIAAECEARVGDKDKAMAHINDIRMKRFINKLAPSEIKLSAATGKEALLKVLDERRREMMMKNQRLFDLKRLNKETETQTTFTHSADGQAWTLAPGSNLYIFPINNVVIGYNPDMPQYDRK